MSPKRLFAPGSLDQVAAWLDKADGATGLVRLNFLRRAQELARLHAMNDIASEIAVQIQSMEPGEFDLKRVSGSASIPEEQFEAYVGAFLGSDWQQSLERFGAIGPPEWGS